MVPRDGALGWRKTHFGHPDGHIGRHLAWALILGYNRPCNLDIPSAGLDCLAGRLRRPWLCVTCPEGQFWDITLVSAARSFTLMVANRTYIGQPGSQ